MRYSPASWPKGKSGALRVCYVSFERWGAVTLLIVYAKSEMDDLPERMKAALNAAIDDLETHLERLFSQGTTDDEGRKGTARNSG